MKKYIILFAAIVFAASTINAQLQINSSGKAKFSKNVAIGTNINDSVSLYVKHLHYGATYPYYGIKSHITTSSSMPTGPVYGVFGFADASASASSYSLSPLVGVCGKAMKRSEAAYNFSAGVAGVGYYYNGIGVYGAISGDGNLPLPTSWSGGCYAGYFGGSVQTSGTLNASLITVTNDYRLNSDIQTIDSRSINSLSALKPVSYKLKPDSTQFVYVDGAKEMELTHYGFIAQDVQKVFPNLVYKNGSGFLSINYMELIPLLVKEINDLKEKIEIIEAQQMSDNSAFKKVQVSSIVAKLYQNNPNPFNKSTEIRYELPLETNNANLYIYDMNGTQIAAYNLTDFGSSSITISAGELNAGMYLYSLIADGQLIDTKQMILTK